MGTCQCSGSAVLSRTEFVGSTEGVLSGVDALLATLGEEVGVVEFLLLLSAKDVHSLSSDLDRHPVLELLLVLLLREPSGEVLSTGKVWSTHDEISSGGDLHLQLLQANVRWQRNDTHDLALVLLEFQLLVFANAALQLDDKYVALSINLHLDILRSETFQIDNGEPLALLSLRAELGALQLSVDVIQLRVRGGG